MKKIPWLIACPFIFALAIAVSPADSPHQPKDGEKFPLRPPPLKQPTFTNADLEKSRGSGNVTSHMDSKTNKEQHRKNRTGDALDKSLRNKILKIDRRIETVKLKIDAYDEKLKGMDRDPAFGNSRFHARKRNQRGILESRKQKAVSDLDHAVREKRDTEEEARRKGVLPGVLRGQRF